MGVARVTEVTMQERSRLCPASKQHQTKAAIGRQKSLCISFVRTTAVADSPDKQTCTNMTSAMLSDVVQGDELAQAFSLLVAVMGAGLFIG